MRLCALALKPSGVNNSVYSDISYVRTPPSTAYETLGIT